MFVRLEKICPEKRQRRFYAMSVARTLFGEWCLVREWGRIGTAGGQRMVDYTATRETPPKPRSPACARRNVDAGITNAKADTEPWITQSPRIAM